MPRQTKGRKTMRGISKEDPSTLFVLEESLGEGSYGEVFSASWKDGSKSEKVAVKIIPVDEDLAELEKEIEILRDTKDTYVVDFIGAYHDKVEDRIWIVMELCAAGSVNDLIHICQTSLSEEEIRVVTASCLLGLHYLHKNRMIHRDIKAGNVLLTDTGHAKLADFGVSAQLGADQSKRKTVIGTPFWMSPEVISESSYDGKADIWSLGITIIEMAEMEPPYSNIHPMRAIFMIPSRPPPKLVNPGAFSDELNSFLERCLQKDPDDRPTAEELMDDPFVQDAVQALESADDRGKSPVIAALVEKHIDMIRAVRLEEASKSYRSGTTYSSGTRGNTAHYEGNTSKTTVKAGGATMHEGLESGTLIAASGKGTSIFTPSEKPGATVKKETPAFMAYFQARTVKYSPKQVEDEEPDWVLPDNSKEMIELTNRLKHLDHQFQRDVTDLRKAYEQRRSALLTAANAD